MAGDWIKWTVGLENKKEIVRAAAESGLSRGEVAARFMRFCEWADQNIPEEDISCDGPTYVKLSPRDGDNRAFVSELLGSVELANSFSSNWIKYRNGRIELPNFSRHNGKTAKTRARNSKSQNKKRKQKEAPPPKKGVTDLSPRDSDKKVTREREEKSINSLSLPPPFHEKIVSEKFSEWFAYLAKRGKAPVDPDLAASQTVQFFSSPDSLVKSIAYAIAQGYVTLKDYTGEIDKNSDRAEAARKSRSMPTGPGQVHPDDAGGKF